VACALLCGHPLSVVIHYCGHYTKEVKLKLSNKSREN